MATIWQAHGGDRAKLPVVDFDSQMVACVFVDAGEYAVAPVIQDVEAQDGFVRVRYRFSRPVFSPVNNPASVVSVPRSPGVPHFTAIE